MNDIDTTNVNSIESDISFSIGISCYGKTNIDECFVSYNVFIIKKEMALNGLTHCDFAKIHEFSEILDNSDLKYNDNDAYIYSIMKASEYVSNSSFRKIIKCIYFNAASFDSGVHMPLKNVSHINNEDFGFVLENFMPFSFKDIFKFKKLLSYHYIELEKERSNFINYEFAKSLKNLCTVNKQSYVSEKNANFIEKVKSGEIAPTPFWRLSKQERKRLISLGYKPETENKKEDELIIHTDGSIHRYGDKSGYGCIVLNKNQEKIFNLIGSIPFVKKRLNIQYVEMYAIYRALLAIKNKISEKQFIENISISVYSDSKNCIDCLNGSFPWNGHADAEILKDLYRSINNLGLKVKYKNVKGHSGDEFNEYADSLARQGAMKDFKGEMISYYNISA